jgi:hypothetical protein
MKVSGVSVQVSGFSDSISVDKKTERSDTIILGILAHFRHFRHFSGLSGLGLFE